MTRLCVALTEKTTEAMLAAMRELPHEVDLVELRLDLMARCDLQPLIAGRDRPVIATNRPRREGGACDLPEAERLAVLRRAADLGAEYVDVELDSVAALGALPGGTARIVSRHDFERTPSDLEAILRKVLAAGPDVAKVAVRANDAADVPPVLELLRRYAGTRPVIALSMGEEGLAGRVLAAKLGAFLTYASRAQGAESAPGQLPWDELLGLYRFRSIGPGTRVYGVVANPVAHSMSPTVHNAAFAALDLDAVYLPFKVTDTKRFFIGFLPFDLRGLSVAIPHKEAFLGLVDEADEVARRVRAVNCVRVDEARIRGWNTDVTAAVQSLEGAVRRSGRAGLGECRVLLVGAGGAARAFAHGLAGRAASLTIANRTVERARTLAAEVGAEACGLDEMVGLQPDVIVNGTSVGMWPQTDASAVPAGMLRAGIVVFDSVYNPPHTRLLAEAAAAGAVTASGVEWFVSQAAVQFELWTGRPAPREVMDEAFRRRLGG